MCNSRTITPLGHLLLTVALAGPGRLQAQVPPYTAADFPPAEGYYFLTTLNFQGNNQQSQMLILDGAAQVAFRRTVASASSFRPWPDGRMSYATVGQHLLLDGSFAVIDTVTCVNDVPTDLHDIRLLPNGHYLMLGIESRTMDLSGVELFPPGDAPGSSNAVVRSGVIQELDANEQLVWEWHLADHIDFMEVDPARLNNPNNVDWSHSNALELDADGNILLSNRHFNSIIKVNRNNGEIMWSLGGASNDFDFGGDPGFWGQHDIRRLPNGHITLFDNGLADTHPCRAVEYALDETAMTATAVWSGSYGGAAWSRAMGSVQRLDNGNTVVGWGALTPDNAAFSILLPDGGRLGDLRFADTLATYRAYYFEDLPFEVPRPAISCTMLDGAYQLTTEAGWPNYLWSTGATGPSITVGALDTVYVEVPAGPMLGWFRSEPYVVASDCLTNDVVVQEAVEFTILPNPVHDRLNLLRANAERADLLVMDALGRAVLHRSIAGPRASIDLAGLPNGTYFVKVDGRVERFVIE